MEKREACVDEAKGKNVARSWMLKPKKDRLGLVKGKKKLQLANYKYQEKNVTLANEKRDERTPIY